MEKHEESNHRSKVLRAVDAFLAKFLRDLVPGERRYLVLVPAIGILSGLAAVGLRYMLEGIQELCWGEPEGAGEGRISVLEAARALAANRPWLPVLIPTLGGTVVAVALLFLRKKERFEGTAGLMEALAFRRGRLPFLDTFAGGLVSITAVGTGASLGREGAMVQSGAALGSWLGTTFHLADHHVRILLACGAAGGMAAAYNAPIGASVFAMEIILGSFALELFGPIIVCSLLSTTVSHVIFRGEPVYVLESLRVAGEMEIILHIGLGGLLGLVSVVFIRVFSGVDAFFRWLRPLPRAKPVIAMFILGLIGVVFPEVFGNGYDFVNAILRERNFDSSAMVLKDGRTYAIPLLLFLPFIKIFVTALCRGGGVPGGLFTPSLFIGSVSGFLFGIAAGRFLPEGSLSSPSTFALVGMGAIISGTLQAPITAILLIFELTRDYSVILPLMAAAISSAVVSHVLQGGSLYIEPLRRKGIYLPSASAPTWIRQPEVRQFVRGDVATVPPAERFRDLTEKFLRAPEGQDHLYVTSSSGECVGVISLHDIKRFFREVDTLDTVIAADVASTDFPCVYASDPISRAIETFAERAFERLPVLDSPETRRLLGTVSKQDLLASYSRANLAREIPNLGVDEKGKDEG